MRIFLGLGLCFLAVAVHGQRPDPLAKEARYNEAFLNNLRSQVLMDRMGSGEVRLADNGDLIFADERGRQSFLYALSPTKALYRLSLAVVRAENLSRVRNVFQGVLLKKDGIYTAGGVANYNKLRLKLGAIPANDTKTRLALASTGWGNVQKTPWVYFRPPQRNFIDDTAIDDAFIVNLQQKKPVSSKYRMGVQIQANGDVYQMDGRGTLTFQYAYSPTEAVYLLSPETASDLNYPSDNAFKGFVIKPKGIFSTGFQLNYLIPQSKIKDSNAVKAYSDLLNGTENINWKQLSREPWFVYHRPPKTNTALNEKFIAALGARPLRDTLGYQEVSVKDNGDLLFHSLDNAEVYFRYALSPSRAVYQISQAYASRRGFYSTNVFFGVIIKKDEVYTASSGFIYEEPQNRTNTKALQLFDERRKSIYNIDWNKTVAQPWMTFRSESQ